MEQAGEDSSMGPLCLTRLERQLWKVVEGSSWADWEGVWELGVCGRGLGIVIGR